MLAPSLEYIKQFPQFIIYKTTPRAGSDKLDKVPVDFTGAPASAHDPQQWMSYENAQAIKSMVLPGDGYGIGFVITADTKVFCLDVDGALMPNGQWHHVASALCAMLTGAAVEVSISGKGLHAWGLYVGDEPAHGSRAVVDGIGLELYTSGRFIALGNQSTAVGNAGTDCTDGLKAVIATYFPQSAGGDAQGEWAEGHCKGWILPDDDQLIEHALRFTPGANSAFGNKVSLAQLWNRDVAALSVAFPIEGREFDESQADLALASKLAWLTGNDCPRIERLMRRSGLVRAKWDSHQTYLCEFTIPRALRTDDNFYNPNFHTDEQKRRREQIEENLRIGEGTEEHPSSSVLTEDEMLARYVNIIEGKRVVDLDHPRRIFALDEWKSAHKSSRTVLEVEGEYKPDGTPKTKSHETTRLWEMNPARKQVDTVTFRPGSNRVTVDPDGKTAANTWRPIERTPALGDGSLFDLHVSYLFGADAPRFLDWLAHIEQRPGELPHAGWVHISPMQGTGRNWLASVLCRLWRGHVAASFDLAGTLRTGFNGPLSQKLLAVVDEIDEGGQNARWENAEVLKSLVTAEHRHINPKYGHQRVEYNACRWLIFSNHTSALPLTERDRRFNIVRNDNPPMPAEYYGQLYAALKDPRFIASVAWTLRTRDVSTFNPGSHAVMNEAKRELVGASRSDADDIIAHLVADHPADVIANSTLGAMLTNQPFGKLTPHHRHALERAGVRPYEKPIWLGSRSARVSILRNHSVWKEAAPHQIQAEIAKVPPATGAPSFGEWATKAPVN
jgi:primase-polymerase (primpol)-like protein